MLRSYPEIVKGLLRSAWNAPSALPAPPRRVWRDWALLAVLVVAAVTEGMLRVDRSSSAIDVVALLAVLPTVLWRRTQPLLMLAIVFAVTVPVDLLFPDQACTRACSSWYSSTPCSAGRRAVT